MKKIQIVFSLLCLLVVQAMAQTGTTSWVSVGTDGKLKYTPDAKGNVIPDFSAVGYKNGEVAIPNAPVVRTISAVSGDNTSNIQNAINAVAAMPMNADGIRGAILLKAGTYNINNNLYIRSSGVVIRGEGNATKLMATKTSQYSLITITGSGGASAVGSTSKKIQGSYIPIGAKTFTLPAGHGFATGDDVMLQRKPNQAWINMLGMNVLSQIPCDNGGCNSDWTPGEYTINYLRKIVAVNGNSITLDAPNIDVIDSKYAEGFIMKYNWSGKIENSGVENLYIDSKYTNANDENHGWHGVSFSNSKNGWVRNVEVHHFGYAAVTVNESAAWISILDCKNIDPISQTIGGRKYSFNINGQRNLVKNCSTNGGRHDYVTGAQTAGPNAFVNSTAVNQKADIGPHHRWGTGALFDNIKGDFEQNAQNRLGYGTGHGWSGAQTMYWNCTSPTFRIHNPTQHLNWAIGCKGKVTDVGNQYTGSPGVTQSTGNFIGGIQFLYDKQLADRLNATPVVESPYTGTPIVLPGKIEAENYDLGGEGLAYHDSESANQGGAYRTEGVDIQATTDVYGGSNVGYTVAGEWMKYMVNVTATGLYNLDFRTASTSATGAIRVEVDGADVTGSVVLPNTGAWQTWATTRVSNISLPAGAHTIRLFIVEGSFNLNYVSVILAAPACLPASASGDDGNVAANVLDNNLTTRWSANGDGQWIQFCQGTPQVVTGVKIAFFSGDVRQSKFDVQVSQDGLAWSNVLTNVQSSGTGLGLETFTFASQTPKFVRILGHGNTVNTWNSYTEVQLVNQVAPNVAPTVTLTAPSNNASYVSPASIVLTANAADVDGTVTKVEFYNGTTLLGTSTSSPYSYTWSGVTVGSYVLTVKATDNLNASTTSSVVNVTVTAPEPTCLPASASSDDGNVAANVLDNDLNTRWSANGDGQYIQFCLASAQDVSGIQIAFYNGNVRQSKFDVQVSNNETTWTNVLINVSSSGTSLALEQFTFTMQSAKYVRIVGHGNTVNTWNSITEVKILTGTVTPPVNQVPTVSLTSPANNAAYNAPASITMNATAADADGNLSKVEFYNGTTLLGTDVSSPYTYTWSNVAAGTYSITAKATDNLGATKTSTAVSVKVNTVVVNDPCAGIATYVENGSYVPGSKVKTAGKQYQCKPYPYAGWCNGAAWAYGPGTGAYWSDAWTLIGTCSSGARSSSSSEVASVNETLVTNAPNPFVASTNIEIVVAESGEVSVMVYDKTGQVVGSVVEGYLSAGTHTYTFDATNLKADMYIIKMNTNSQVITRKMVKSE